MGRTYVRKTENGAGKRYTRRELELAVQDVKEGRRTMRGAGKFYNIPRSTLIHYVRGTSTVDELWYDEKDILKIISPPTPVNKRGIFNVPELEKYLT